MKKIALLLSIAVLICTLCSCGGTKTEPTTETTAESTTNDEVAVHIRKDLLVDEASFVSEIQQFEGITVNSTDEKIILVMNSAAYDNLVAAKNNEAVESYNDILSEEGTYVEKFDYDENFRHVKVYVNRQGFDAIGNQNMEYIKFAGIAMAYQMYLPNGQRTTIELIYSDNEEVIGISNFPNNVELTN